MNDITLVAFELETSSGNCGIGYTLNRGNGGKPVQAVLDHVIGPALLGRSVDHPEMLFELLSFECDRLRGGGLPGLAISAADIAIWDARAQALDRPLFEVLGARRTSGPAYGSSFDRLYNDNDFLETAKEYLAAGISALKIRLGHPTHDDRHRLEILRDAVGEKVSVMVDTNANWDLPTALTKLPLLEEFGVEFLEEPIDPHDIDGFVELQRHTHVPIAGGENLYTLREYRAFVESRAFKIAPAQHRQSR